MIAPEGIMFAQSLFGSGDHWFLRKCRLRTVLFSSVMRRWCWCRRRLETVHSERFGRSMTLNYSRSSLIDNSQDFPFVHLMSHDVRLVLFWIWIFLHYILMCMFKFITKRVHYTLYFVPMPHIIAIASNAITGLSIIRVICSTLSKRCQTPILTVFETN